MFMVLTSNDAIIGAKIVKNVPYKQISASSVCLNNNKYTRNIFLVRVFQFFMVNLFDSVWDLTFSFSVGWNSSAIWAMR